MAKNLFYYTRLSIERLTMPPEEDAIDEPQLKDDEATPEPLIDAVAEGPMAIAYATSTLPAPVVQSIDFGIFPAISFLSFLTILYKIYNLKKLLTQNDHACESKRNLDPTSFFEKIKLNFKEVLGINEFPISIDEEDTIRDENIENQASVLVLKSVSFVMNLVGIVFCLTGNLHIGILLIVLAGAIETFGCLGLATYWGNSSKNASNKAISLQEDSSYDFSQQILRNQNAVHRHKNHAIEFLKSAARSLVETILVQLVFGMAITAVRFVGLGISALFAGEAIAKYCETTNEKNRTTNAAIAKTVGLTQENRISQSNPISTPPRSTPKESCWPYGIISGASFTPSSPRPA